MDIRFKNAVRLSFKNTFFTTSVKIAVVVMMLLSVTISFWPLIWGAISSPKAVLVSSSVPLRDLDDKLYQVVESDEEHADLVVTYSEDKYNLYIKSERGEKEYSRVVAALYNQNINQFVDDNMDDLTEQELAVLFQKNISILTQLEEKEGGITLQQHYFIMIVGVLVMLSMVFLIFRVGADVGNEKGNKITEIILTSIHKRELYFAHVIGGYFSVVISLLLIFLPVFVAGMINQVDVTMDISFITMTKLLLIIVHILLTILMLIIADIAMCSHIKQIEDIGPSNILVMIPCFISYFCFVAMVGMYSGSFYFVNYIPLFSFLQIFGGIIKGNLLWWQFIAAEVVQLAVLVMLTAFGYKIYEKNISRG